MKKRSFDMIFPKSGSFVESNRKIIKVYRWAEVFTPDFFVVISSSTENINT